MFDALLLLLSPSVEAGGWDMIIEGESLGWDERGVRVDVRCAMTPTHAHARLGLGLAWLPRCLSGTRVWVRLDQGL